MKVLENSMATRRMSDALLIDSLAMILITHGGMTRPAETEIWEPFYWLKGRQLTWSNVTFWRMNDAFGMRILLLLTKDLSILMLKMLESIPIPMIAVGNGCSYREWKSWRRTVFHLLTYKTARSLYYSLTMLASWEKGWQSINWVRSFVVLLLDYSGMKYSWRHSAQELRLQGGTVGGGLTAAVIAAAAINAFVLCSAAIFWEVLAAAVLADFVGFVGEVNVYSFVIVGGHDVELLTWQVQYHILSR